MFEPPIKSIQIQKKFASGSLEFELAFKRKVVPYLSFYHIAKFGKFWTLWSDTTSNSRHDSKLDRGPPVSNSK
jgi:hypothetical protein